MSSYLVQLLQVPLRTLAVWVVVAAGWGAPECQAQDGVVIPQATLDVIAAWESLVGQEPWPNFVPLDYPLAIFDGAQTLLVNHPQPPEEFSSVSGLPTVAMMTGQHPLVTANTAVVLGSAETATILLNLMGDSAPAAVVAVAAHEAFHVFQGRYFPGWVADETQLFLYPADDKEILALRRAESAAWRQSLLADDGLPYARLALDIRRGLNNRREDGIVGYERGLELKEGLAQYVQDRCQPDREPTPAPEAGWGAEVVRQRAYVTGATMAHLLDRCDPGWKERMTEEDGANLDDLLSRALRKAAVVAAEVSWKQALQYQEVAAVDAQAVAQSRKERRAAFLAEPGPAIVVRVSGGRPLSPQGFDPLNVRSLGGRDVLHTRWLNLKRDGAEITVDGRDVLTEGAGVHPLFGGVRELLMTGLPEAPLISGNGETSVVNAAGFVGRFEGASFEHQGPLLIITLL
ncbi:MAG: hypothetical protein ACI9EF_001902 [Pseudohongiellaceae bacterium]|jgi:hypothetical protein